MQSRRVVVFSALLNDGAILSIAYDNVHYRDQPEAWNMRMVLGISMVLGIIGVVSAFGLFYLGERVFHLDRAHIQTMTPLGWGWAGFVWGYALLWFLFNDRVKLLAYRIFDPVRTRLHVRFDTSDRKSDL